MITQCAQPRFCSLSAATDGGPSILLLTDDMRAELVVLRDGHEKRRNDTIFAALHPAHREQSEN